MIDCKIDTAVRAEELTTSSADLVRRAKSVRTALSERVARLECSKSILLLI